MIRKISTLWMSAACLALAGPLLSAARAETPAPDPLKKAGEVSFCTELGQPPAAYLAADGETPEGFEVDIMKAIGAELGLKTRITNYKFAGIFAALDANKCDAVMSSTSKNPQRLEKYVFVDYMQVGSGLLVKKGNPLNLRTYEDLAGRKVAVLLGSANERRLKESSDKVAAAGKPPIDIVGYNSNAVAFKELDLGRMDAFVSGSLTLGYFMLHSNGKFEIGGTPVPPTTLGIMLPKAETAKAAAIGAAYAAVMKNGEMAKIIAKWGAQDAALLCDGAHKCD